MVATTLTQTMKIEKAQVTLRSEIIKTYKVTREEKMTKDAKIKKMSKPSFSPSHTFLFS